MSQAIIIDGKQEAAEIALRLKERVSEINAQYRKTPTLAVLLLGEDPASKIYVRSKINRAKEIGMEVLSYELPASTTPEYVFDLISSLNENVDVNGILVQLPLPIALEPNLVINSILPSKDVDGFTVTNIGLLNSWQQCLEPSTPLGVLHLLKKHLGEDLSSKKAVVLGRSLIVGRPMASMLIRESCTVTLLHSRSNEIEKECLSADILISAVGKPGLITEALVKPGACVIDVGITRVGDTLKGDVDFESVKNKAKFITPVPGGVGPMTVIMMLSNVVKAFEVQHGI